MTHHHKHVPNTTDLYLRQVLWLRYLNWALSTPLLLVNFALISGLPGGHLLAAIAANFVMLAAGVLGTFAGHTRVRWVWLVIVCVAYLVMLHNGGFHAQRAARGKDVQTRRFFGALSGLGFVAFALFPM
jgi:bacteriorhodopsin